MFTAHAAAFCCLQPQSATLTLVPPPRLDCPAAVSGSVRALQSDEPSLRSAVAASETRPPAVLACDH